MTTPAAKRLAALHRQRAEIDLQIAEELERLAADDEPAKPRRGRRRAGYRPANEDVSEIDVQRARAALRKAGRA